jgi:GPR1/FUN34/yaaH family
MQPAYNAWGAYSPDPTKPALGLSAPPFLASYAFFFLAMALACAGFAVCALRTNAAFLAIFATLVVAFCALTGSYWRGGRGGRRGGGSAAEGRRRVRAADVRGRMVDVRGRHAGRGRVSGAAAGGGSDGAVEETAQ